MPRPLAEAGQASNLASLPILDLANRGVQGDGYLDFTKDHSSVQLKWIPNQYTEFTFGGQDESRIQGISRTLEKFNIEAVALGRSVNTNPGVAGYVDLCEIWATGLKLESHQLRTKYNAYMSRMGLLRDEAERDGYALNLASEIDFRQFVRFAPDIRKGNLVLMDNGNLRAIWRDEQGARLGLQFLVAEWSSM